MPHGSRRRDLAHSERGRRGTRFPRANCTHIRAFATVALFVGVLFASSACQRIACVRDKAKTAFELRLPIEVHTPAEEPRVRLPISIKNASENCICFACRCEKEWRFGLVPDWQLVDRQGSVLLPEARVHVDGLAGRVVAPGESLDGAAWIELLIDPSAPVDAVGRIVLRAQLRQWDDCDAQQPTVDATIDVRVRRPGTPVLVSWAVPFSSELQEP